MSEPVAVVGIGGLFPDAPDPARYWENVAAARSAARPVPAGRWLLEPERVLDPVRGAPDKVYSTSGCFVDGFRLDPAGLALDPALLEALDPVFHFALHASRQALADCKAEGVDRRRVGVILGNLALPTDAFSAFSRRILAEELRRRVPGAPSPSAKPVHPYNRWAAGLPAALVAQGLGLGGGAYTLDAACASSLYALSLACDTLASGRADAMLAGGVSRPDCLYTQMGFSQMRALSASGRPAPLDASGDGLVVGEGAGVFVLKRLRDARRQGDRIYGVLRGIGLSNDIGGSLLAPDTGGQMRAMKAAYEAAGWTPDQVDLVECHAAGTPVGDAVELESLRALWGDAGWRPRQCVLGSAKSNVGHLLTAAGAAGLMKVLLALRERTLPPSANFSKPVGGVDLDATPFRVLSRSEAWPERAQGVPRRAAVSAFGFGGINGHVLLEEWIETPAAAAAYEVLAPAAPQPPEIAIIGMDARFGTLGSLREFQEAVLSGAPARERCPAELSVPAKAYRIPPKEFEEMLPQQILMLQSADAALRDADAHARHHERTGVFVGMELDCGTANFDFRWSLPEALRDEAGPPLTANRTMGALGGIISSRIAREFRIGGPSFTIAADETCGLRALEAACRALRNGQLDCAVVGAVDVAGDLRARRAEADLGRLGPDAARPFDAAACGAPASDGAAAVVLKRLEDALRDGDRVYAVVKGLGAASGAPAARAQTCSEALERAYRDGGVDPASVDYVEASASAVRAEDDAEAQAQGLLLAGRPERAAPVALGALTPVIGRPGAASGLASLVKAALAVYQQILPPFALAAPAPALAAHAGRLHSPRRAQFWLRNRADGPRRAGVTAVGLGGNCAHAVLEECKPSLMAGTRPVERRQPLGARREALFVVEEVSAPGLAAACRRFRAWAEERPEVPVEALARAWWTGSPLDGRRGLAVAFVARDARELAALAATAERSLKDDPGSPIQGMDRIFYSPLPVGRTGRVAFVFPGSGNQYIGMGVDVSAQWPEVLRAQDEENGRLRDQMVPHLLAPWRLTWEPGWEDQALETLAGNHKAMIFGQVSHGAVLSDLVRSFGVKPDAVIGYSLGETAGLFALRVWRDRDEMLRRMHASTLFVSDLAGECNAARRSWGLAAHEAVDWALGVIDQPEKMVRAAVDKMEKVFVLIVNTPKECVVGGTRQAVRKMVQELGANFLPLEGVTTVHCSVAREVEAAYRELHLLPTAETGKVQFYSGAWARPYPVTRESAADSIVAQAIGGIDFPAVINRAYDDGVRAFIELGPRNSCSRMIARILGDRPHAARSACMRDQEDVSTILRLLGHLCAERVPVDLAPLYGGESLVVGHRDSEAPRPMVVIPVGLPMPIRAPATNGSAKRQTAKDAEGAKDDAQLSGPPSKPTPSAEAPFASLAPFAVSTPPVPASATGKGTPVLEALLAARQATSEAHERFLKLAQSSAQAQLRALALQAEIAAALPESPAVLQPAQDLPPPVAAFAPAVAAPEPAVPVPAPAPFMTREQCMEFAAGKIGKALGAAFAHVDAHPTRVRLPDEPLMLVDRILSVTGEPGSLSSGAVVTEHDVREDGWYLDGGRIPTCIAVEAGQADLFLSGYLGIDSQTQGLAVYRLLDAEVTFHEGLPRPGETIRYDIRILRFARQGDTWIFFFEFDSTVAGRPPGGPPRPLLTMRKGCAGFFTPQHLAEGKGIVFTELDRRRQQGKRPADWKPPAPMGPGSYDEAAVEALREGRLADAFGGDFSGLPLRRPARLPGAGAPTRGAGAPARGAGGGRMRLVDRVLELDPSGGRWGLGLIRTEADIHPDDWFLTCHFSDDPVMPGTLMYECCLHTLRIFLTRLGWVGEEGECGYEPVPGVASKLKCRGQVLPTTRKATYEISIKELGYGPEPYAIADALMLADGHPIVLITDMSVRLRGLDREKVEALWSSAPSPLPSPPPSPASGRGSKVPLFDTGRILAFAVGKPSEAFGEPYRVFDSERVIARLPGPPYQFLDRIVSVRDARPFVLQAGARVEAEYDVPPDAWYFRANRQGSMPFAVLLEVALQPCGWLAAYLGSALTSEADLSFRNLGGKAVLHEEVFPEAGTLATRIKLTRVSQSAGMIIQNYDMEIRRGGPDPGRGGRLVYQGDTYFGFFSKEALADQKGILGVTPYQPTGEERARGVAVGLPDLPPFHPVDGAMQPADTLALPARALRMLDSIPLFVHDGGPKGLGFVRGIKKVDPAEWFFKAHFFQDPVCPGSLGLESFQQLLKAVARDRWAEVAPAGGDAGSSSRFTPIVPGQRHEWVYRGQVIPRNKVVTVEAVITEADDRQRRLTADGFLSVDGLLIYQMKGFSLAVK